MTVDHRRHFEDHAAVYADRVVPLFAVTHEHLTAWADGLDRPARILDVACGDGRLAVAMSRLGHRVLGCDQSAGLIRRAGRGAHAAAPPGVAPPGEGARSGPSWLRADAQALPFAAASVDAVVCNLGVQFFDRPVTALREMGRVVRPGGPVVLVVPEPPGGRTAAVDLTPRLAEAGLAVGTEVELARTARVADAPTLLAVWRVEMGPSFAPSRLPEADQAELAEAVLAKGDGAVGLALRFRAYHCAGGRR